MLIYLQMIDSPEKRTIFEELYIKYKNLMFYVANQILHNSSDSEDAVHQAFVKIAENIEKIQDVNCPKTKSLVVTIVENKAIDLYRKKQRTQRVELNEEIQGIPFEYNGSGGLAECILKLPVRYREMILLKYYHGYSTKEAAGILGITNANASKLDQRAKSRLYDLCKKEGIL
ncbi:MAG: RNA polymerase sigma factor [Floccifex porci]|uniref:RNA polymerase sigma factor n=1 Tax=Floccifex porci TaxID=2606629 RepID=UPI003F0480BD